MKPCEEEVLHFDTFNFKLAVLEVLIYRLEILGPYFDVHEFAEKYEGEDIDTESFDPLVPVMDFFKNLPVPKRLAESVEEIYMDGGDSVYGNIIPLWDGEDGFFDLADVTHREIAQFPNLKKITLMASDFDKVAKVFRDAGVEVEAL